ncbi:hypothetical protein BaRGS_00006047 [Batillaria attramentaria]|uniref:Uncharacterized protein n=1 Tax=Batillaria attramentaria TaxID=370345 RepID=A0ABD0LV46_9CAEN
MCFNWRVEWHPCCQDDPVFDAVLCRWVARETDKGWRLETGMVALRADTLGCLELECGASNDTSNLCSAKRVNYGNFTSGCVIMCCLIMLGIRASPSRLAFVSPAINGQRTSLSAAGN